MLFYIYFVISELKLMYKKETPFDMFAIFIFLNLPFYTLIATLCPVILLIGGWDPIYLVLYTGYYHYVQKVRKNILVDNITHSIFKLIGFSITFADSQCVGIIMRNFILLTCGLASSFLRLLNKCVSYRACRHAYLLYHNMYMCYSIVSKFANSIVGLYVVFSVVSVLAGTRTTIQALKTESFVMGVMGVSITVLFVIVSIFSFEVGEFILGTSSGALKRWKHQSKILGRLLLYKCIVATQPILLRLGGIHRGVINVQMEKEYFNVVLNVVMNVVIISN